MVSYNPGTFSANIDGGLHSKPSKFDSAVWKMRQTLEWQIDAWVIFTLVPSLRQRWV
jgi:hypothetical protein